MAVNTVELRQQRQRIVEELRKLQEGLLERGSETAEETEQFARMEADIVSLETIINREERLQKLEGEAAQRLDEARNSGDPGQRWDGIRYPVAGVRQPSAAEINRRASYAIQGWLRAGKPNANLTEEHIEAAKSFGFDPHSRDIELPLPKNYRQLRRELRDLNVATSTKGLETIPEGFVSALEQALLEFGGVRSVADIVRTDSGNDLPWPTSNDTSNKGEILDEATSFGSSVDPGFAQIVFKAFKYSSKLILVSSELLQDSAFDLAARIGEMLGIRIGRIQNDHFTTGAGTTLPKGLTVAGVVGKVAASPTAITADEVIDLEHSVDPAYRTGASFMFHDNVLAAVRKLKESTTNAYIWQPGLQAGVPDRLLGYPYTINQSMASSLIASAKVMLFGDMRKYKIRDVASMRLLRLDERYADTDQVAFVAFMRSDGNLLDAGTRPVKWLALAAS